MPKITSLEDLNRLQIELVLKHNEQVSRGLVFVAVGLGTCGIAVGALDVFHVFEEEIKAEGLADVVLSQTGCIGLCAHEPIVEVTIGTQPKVSYGAVTPGLAMRILHEHVMQGKPVEECIMDMAAHPAL